jgi:hypothetical protein
MVVFICFFFFNFLSEITILTSFCTISMWTYFSFFFLRVYIVCVCICILMYQQDTFVHIS